LTGSDAYVERYENMQKKKKKDAILSELIWNITQYLQPTLEHSCSALLQHGGGGKMDLVTIPCNTPLPYAQTVCSNPPERIMSFMKRTPDITES